MTRPCREGWSRLTCRATPPPCMPFTIRSATCRRSRPDYGPVWYATEGHVNARNGGIVITQANRDELERVCAACARISTGKGSIDSGAKSDSAWRLYLGIAGDSARSYGIIAASFPSTSGCRTSCSGSRRRTCNMPSTN